MIKADGKDGQRESRVLVAQRGGRAVHEDGELPAGPLVDAIALNRRLRIEDDEPQPLVRRDLTYAVSARAPNEAR